MSFELIFKYLRSLKFTLVLLALLIVLSAISTFTSTPDSFFGSLGFFAIVFLFFVNLSCCTVYRFLRELKKKSGRNFGPDILHGGLVLFLVAALISSYNRMEGQIALVIGESVGLPEGSVLTLDDFEYRRYENGRPMDWISYLTIKNSEGEIVYTRHPLRVNHPLNYNGYNFYQTSYGEMGGGMYSIIQAVKEPLYILVVAAFIIIGVGTFATFIVKLRKLQRRAALND